MAEVFNWQINRTMSYPYEEARPKKQAAAVFDTNKCIACQTCTLACKTCWTSGKGQEYMLWNNVETKPWGSYPLAWDVEILSRIEPGSWDAQGTYRGRTIFESAPAGSTAQGWMPSDLDYAYPNKGEDETSAPISPETYTLELPHDIWFFYLPRICNHCTYPGCLQACPRQSIYKRPEDGIVLLDQSMCRGYRACMEACPYKKVFYNHVTRVSEKCVMCYPAVEEGVLPRCMRNCIGKIRTFGFVSTPENVREDNPVDFLVHVRKAGLPLYPQLGLEPNIYYIPPVHVSSTPFLTMLFGPGVSHAVEAYQAAMAGDDPELRAVLLLSLATDLIVHSFEIRGDKVVGFDENRDEIVRVPLREPIMIRPEFDAAVSAYRKNVT
jgi:nitrate reductase beta subunit